jgi:hypothetical protein
MNLLRAVLSLGLAALLLAACQKAPPPAAATPTAAASAPETPARPASPAASPSNPPNGVFNLVGVVTKVEDAGYPMFALTVLPDGQTETIGLLFNNEAASRPKDLEISAFEGKRAAIAYTRKPQLDLVDLTLAGKSLLTRQPGEVVGKPEASVTGKLAGAKKLSAGDLPDVITVTDAAGKKFEFEMFISDKPVVAANGKEVTASYDNSQREDATAIKLAPPKP